MQGNWIGVDVTGTNALPNSQGISINTGASTNRIGGTTAAARNIISGNLLNGMVVSGAHHNFIEGNFIGLDRAGQKPLGNGNDGVLLLGASFNTIGGVDVPAGNYISANGGNGIELAGSNGTSGISSSSNSVMGNFLGLPAPVGAGTALRSARLQRVESDGESWGPSRTTFLNGYQFRGNGVRLTFGDDNRIGSPNPLVGFNTIAMRNSPGISGLAGNGNIVLGGTFYGCGEAPLIRFEPGANRSVIRPSTSLTMVSVLNPQWLSFALNLTAEPNSTINCYCYGRFYLPMSDTGANRSWTMDTYVGDNFVTTDGTGVGPAFGTWPIGMTGLVVTTVDQHNDCSSTSPYSLVIPGSVSRDLWKLDLGYSTSSKSFHLSNPFAFYLQGKESLDKPWVNLSYGIDYQIRPEKSDYDYYRGVLGVTTGILSGTITGTTIGLKPADEIRLSGGAPSFRFTTNTFALSNAPTGVVELTIEKRVETVDPTTGSTNHQRVEVPVTFTNAAPGVPIVLKVEIAPVTAKPCKCSAWCGIVGATVDGVQTVVTAGGKFGNCPDDAVVTVTGPGGIELSLSNSADGRRARKSFSPAGNGVWTVTTTICGVSKTCTISLP